LAPCQVGGAVVTPAFDLPDPIRHVVHAVGPRFGKDEPADDLLRDAYLAALARCDEVGASSVAFPSISTGAYGFPIDRACAISVAALRGADTQVERCLLVAFDDKTRRRWEAALT
jgi:O-acetyl-ADP-ribose deacetylase (regulator of RNase III)